MGKAFFTASCDFFFLHMNQSTGNQDTFEVSLKPLWLRAQSGDEKAYQQALIQIADRLRTFLRRRMLDSMDEVEDLIQETLLAIHVHRSTYDSSFPVSAWVFAIAKHKLIDFWRRRGRKEAHNIPLDLVQESAMPFANEVGSRLDLEQLLKTLPKAQSQAILLTKLQGLSIAEVSQQTGISESAIKAQVHRGLKKLATLTKDG